jgi:hypothetical protein
MKTSTQKMWDFFQKFLNSAKIDHTAATVAAGAAMSGGAVSFYLMQGRPNSIASAAVTAATVFAACIIYEAALGLAMGIIGNRRLPWLIHNSKDQWLFQDIQKIEQGAVEGSKIYIITHNLTLDLTNEETISTVKINLGKFVKYTFVVTRDASLDARLRALADKHSSHAHDIDVYRLAPNWMRLAAYDNLMLIVAGEQSSAFLRIPDTSGDWWARMSKDGTLSLARNIAFFEEIAAEQHEDATPSVKIVKLSRYLVPKTAAGSTPIRE